MIEEDLKLFSYLITISYDGSNFFGWARQKKFQTIQGLIEEKLSFIFNQELKILSSSRTDKGVHAIEQNFTMRIGLRLSNQRLLASLQKIFKDEIVVKRVRLVNDSFHPIKNVVKKEYRYFINTKDYNLFKRNYQWEYCSDINNKCLKEILNVFKGRHNFFNFCHIREFEKVRHELEREIISIKSWKKNGLITISLLAKSFLRYQVRAIIGESISCYENKQSLESLKQRLDDGFQDKKNKYKNLAPSSGLYLWKIWFKFD